MVSDKNLPHQKHDIRPEEIHEHLKDELSNLHCDIHNRAEKIKEEKNGESLNLTPHLEDKLRSAQIKQEKLIKCQSFQVPKETEKKKSFFSKLFKNN